MKGKKLYHLLSSLNRKERKQLYHQMTLSGDKRYDYLKKLLEANILEATQLSELMEEVLQEELKGKSTAEQDKVVRRLMSFLCKVIEDLLLANYLANNPENRNRLLTEISQQKQTETLQKIYLEKTLKLADKESNNSLKNLCLDWQINLYGQQQKDKNLKIISELLKDKEKHINYLYHEQLSFFYRLLSIMCLDDIRLIEKNKPTYQKLEHLAAESSNPFYAAEYKITKARFAFFEADFNTHIEEAEVFVQQVDLEQSQVQSLLRRIYFLKMGIGFQQGKPLEELLLFAKKVVEIGWTFKYKDSFSFFYYQLFLVLTNPQEKVNQETQKYGHFFYTKETLFYRDFITGFQLLKAATETDSLHKALHIFSQLTHSPNYYISLWSKLLELKIHYELAHIFLCKSLLERIKTFLNKNKHRPFTYEASRFIYTCYRKRLSKQKLPVIRPSLSPLHQFIFDEIP